MLRRALIVALVAGSIARAAMSNCFFLPNIALNGGTYDEIKTSDLNTCCIACARDSCCIAYTLDQRRQRCYLKAAITDSTKSPIFTSGIKANLLGGQAAILRNIKLEGGSASIVKLPTTDECSNYCTAYGISSFSPPVEGSLESNGDCSCMSRISTIEYSFGSRSTIFPAGVSVSEMSRHRHH